MTVILQKHLPEFLQHERPLPGIAPCDPNGWLLVDEAFSAQMAYRAELIKEKRDAVLWMDTSARAAADELLNLVLDQLPALGFSQVGEMITRPDGEAVVLNRDAPLWTLGHLVQEDLCILQKRGDEHVLTGAILCFPANWRLADKAGHPLSTIHVPVAEYDAGIARRVQRLFDGVRAGQPLWRFNRLTYSDPDLHQPCRKADQAARNYLRSERQCILRLPLSQAVVFTIHTWVVAR